MRETLRNWLPPALVNLIRQSRTQPGQEIVWGPQYPSWAAAQAASSGYDSDEILAKVKAATLKVKNGEAVFERDSVLFEQIQYSWPIVAGLMWVAARHQGRLHVLDFGGSLGSNYFQNRQFLQGLSEVTWSVVEQPHFAACGQECLQDHVLRFYPSLEDCLRANQPQVILLSGVLQYLEFPQALLAQLHGLGVDCLLIDRTPFLLPAANHQDADQQDKVVVQSVPAKVYAASYPCWLFARQPFMAQLTRDWQLMAEFDGLEGLVKSTEGLGFTFNGWVLQKRV